MEFRNWLEAMVSTESIGDSIKRTLEFVVEGDWEFVLRNPTKGKSVIDGILRNEKTRHLSRHHGGQDCFNLNVKAYFEGSWYDSKTGVIESLSGQSKIKIECDLDYAVYSETKFIGVNTLGSRNSYGYVGRGNSGGPLNTPMELANWVKNIVDGFKGFGNGGGGEDNDDSDPEWSPSSGPAKLVEV
jgi:hypothetical protein